LLVGSEDRLWWRVSAGIGNPNLTERDLCRRLASVECASGVKNFHRRLWEHAEEFVAAKLFDVGIARRILAAVAVLIGEDQVEVPTIAKRAIADEAANRGQVVRLDTEAVVVELLDRHVLDRGRIEALERATGSSNARRDVLEPRLIGCDLDSLARSLDRTGLHDALPTLPGELVIVPDAHERPSCAGILQIRIAQIAAIDSAIAFDGQRDMEIAGLRAVGNARDLVNLAVVSSLHLVRIFNDLVDEVAE